MSQCSEDIWRYKQNHELRIGCYAHNNVTLEFASAEDDDLKQIEQIESFIKKKVDSLIVAPNSAVPLSSVIDKASWLCQGDGQLPKHQGHILR